MKGLTRDDSVAGCGVGSYFASEQYLRHGRPSVGLAPTLSWEVWLNFVATFTASVPVLLHAIRGFGTNHLLATTHTRSGRGSSHPLNSLASRHGEGADAGAAGGVHPSAGVTGKVAGVNEVELGEVRQPSASGTTASLRRQSSYGSEVRILGRH